MMFPLSDQSFNAINSLAATDIRASQIRTMNATVLEDSNDPLFYGSYRSCHRQGSSIYQRRLIH